MKILDTLDENTKYEVLIYTLNDDRSCHIKPFGLSIENDFLFLNMFPNKTLSNIRRDNKFRIYFSQDILLFAEALLNQVDSVMFLDNVSYELSCDVVGFDEISLNDGYGKNLTTTIKAKASKIIEHHKTLPSLNRATNQILELLVDFSRFNLMDVDAKNNFIKKLECSEIMVKKTGNSKHQKALELLKKEIYKE